MFDFGMAIRELKNGKKVARNGWNGKNMFIYYIPANSYAASTDVARMYFGDIVPYEAYIAMKTVQNTAVPWLASQTDILAEDWYIVSDD